MKPLGKPEFETHSRALRRHLLGVLQNAQKQTRKNAKLRWKQRHDLAQELFRHVRLLDDWRREHRSKKPFPLDHEHRALSRIFHTLVESLRPEHDRVVRVGQNAYVYSKGRYYQYRYCSALFVSIPENELFSLIPQRGAIASSTRHAILLRLWEQSGSAKQRTSLFHRFMKHFLRVRSRHTSAAFWNVFPAIAKTPEQYVNRLVENIVRVLRKDSDWSVAELRSLLNQYHESADHARAVHLNEHLEDAARIFAQTVEYTLSLRRRYTQTRRVYLLRDMLPMYITDRLLDALHQRRSDAEFFILKRNMLSRANQSQYYFFAIMKLVYDQLDTLRGFQFEDVVRSIKKRVQSGTLDHDLVRALERVGQRLLKHRVILPRSRKTITLIDAGFRGSIVFAIIATAAHLKKIRGIRIPRIDVNLYLSSLIWSDVFRNRTYSPDTSFMWALPQLYHIERLFTIKPRSIFSNSADTVLLGNKDVQRVSLVELIVLTMISRFADSHSYETSL